MLQFFPPYISYFIQSSKTKICFVIDLYAPNRVIYPLSLKIDFCNLTVDREMMHDIFIYNFIIL